MRAVGSARSEGARGLGEAAVHPIVDPVDGGGSLGGAFRAAKREGQHGAQRPLEPLDVSATIGGKAAVVGDPLSDERMGELEQDGPPPAGQQHDLAVEPPGHGGGLIRDCHGRNLLPSRYLRGRRPASRERASPAFANSSLAVSQLAGYGVSWSRV
jgi:hypothetical protein